MRHEGESLARGRMVLHQRDLRAASDGQRAALLTASLVVMEALLVAVFTYGVNAEDPP